MNNEKNTTTTIDIIWKLHFNQSNYFHTKRKRDKQLPEILKKKITPIKWIDTETTHLHGTFKTLKGLNRDDYKVYHTPRSRYDITRWELSPKELRFFHIHTHTNFSSRGPHRTTLTKAVRSLNVLKIEPKGTNRLLTQKWFTTPRLICNCFGALACITSADENIIVCTFWSFRSKSVQK